MKKQKDGINAFLGEDTSFEGKLSFTGTVRLDGEFKGEIFSDGTLIVGDTAKLEATIRVGRLIVSGEVKGGIVARERMEIHAPGKVLGDIVSPVLTIDEGVVFEGTCKMRDTAQSGQEKEGEKEEKKVAVISKSVK